MHELLFHRQKALEDGDLRVYAAQLGLDVAAFDRDRASTAGRSGSAGDVDGGVASGQVLGTPTLFIDGIVHRGGYDPPTPAGRAGRMSRPAHSAPAEGDQKPRRSLTMIAVTRPGVITLLMMRMLFTPLGTP
jgi:hypothetical protein